MVRVLGSCSGTLCVPSTGASRICKPTLARNLRITKVKTQAALDGMQDEPVNAVDLGLLLALWSE